LAIGVGSRDFGGSHGEVKLWEMSRGRVRAVLKGEMGKVRSLAFTPDGKALVTGSGEAVVLWDLAMGPYR
jgi:WD40 repeat protein